MDDWRFEEVMRGSDERWKATVRESERFHAALKRESDERSAALVARMERSEQHFIDALAENSAEIRRLSNGYEDGREAIRAGTRAILSVLDRLDGLEGGTA